MKLISPAKIANKVQQMWESGTRHHIDFNFQLHITLEGRFPKVLILYRYKQNNYGDCPLSGAKYFMYGAKVLDKLTDQDWDLDAISWKLEEGADMLGDVNVVYSELMGDNVFIPFNTEEYIFWIYLELTNYAS